MSVKDAKIRYLVQELDDKERRIQMMNDTQNPLNPGSGSSEERIVALERKVREIEALVKGLTEELLDLKSIAMKLNRVQEERRAELKKVQPAAPAAAPGAAPAGTVVMQKKGRGEAPAAPAPAAPAGGEDQGPMDMIMQPDGTMKMEKRRGDRQYIIASGNFRKGGRTDTRGRPKQDVIVAEDAEKPESSKKK